MTYIYSIHYSKPNFTMGITNSTKPQQEQPPPPSPQPEPDDDPFTCEICIEPMLSNYKFRNNSLCVHPFCVDCITEYLQLKIKDDRVAGIKCPGLNCDQLLDPLCCRTLIPPEAFDKWCDLLCEKALLGVDRCCCPNWRCSAVVVNECGGMVKRSMCPNCKRLFCFSCELPWHAGSRCEESGQLRDENDVEFGVLAERKKWMRCPQCHHCVERVRGCSIVKCRCGSLFCYDCGWDVLRQGCGCNKGAYRPWVGTVRTSIICAILYLLLCTFWYYYYCM